MKQPKETMRLIRRSPYQALAAALAMSLTFFISSIFILLIIGGQIVLNYIEQRPQVIAFFKDNATESQISELSSKVQATGLTTGVKYVSKEEALAIYRERNKNDPLLLESVTADFLPASIDISVKKASDIQNITNIVQGDPQVERVITPQNLVEQLVKWTNTIRIGGIAFVSTLLAVSFLIIIMVIGMRIALRRDEIAIMNLVGATKWYISRPFFIEGALYGVVGASIATFLVYSLLLFYSPNIQNFLGPIQVFPISPLFFVYLWLAEIIAAATIGIVGAAIALFRYLRIE
ncbi:MAG: Cell division protein [Candidatus Curtissbacteria bacterium GW2011_GWA1_40_16]|uniref:Cell division protein FtsX n=1 Tax=Candidatus Curtissbacteria bacterium GW2011_GWA1_40_16 TaxID=1618405 RepID=A0A0G0TWA2_9BACT|nr:MAG: Cell division protein [Candidatus Curtissbacteria bacterium GW2011_GWA1_40_16]